MAESGDAPIPELAPGENLLASHDAALQSRGQSHAGLLLLTNRRLLFCPRAQVSESSEPEVWDVRLTAISRSTYSGRRRGLDLTVNGNRIRIFPSVGDPRLILRTIQGAKYRAHQDARRESLLRQDKRGWPWWVPATLACAVVVFIAQADLDWSVFTQGSDSVAEAEPEIAGASTDDRSPEQLASAPERDTPVAAETMPPHRVVETEDASYGRVVRTLVRIVVEDELNKAELRRLAIWVIEGLKQKREQNAVTLFFYRPGTDTSGRFTLGKVEWAPGGDWGRAGEVRTGDYSQHWTSVEMATAPKAPEPQRVKGLPEAKRREIFRSLVRLQDRGADTDASYSRTAKRYKVSVDTVYAIASEGVRSGWPLP